MKKSLFFLSLMITQIKAQPIPSNIYNFGGGLNVKTSPDQIADNESPNMSNMINGLYGESEKRNGSERFITQAISSNPINSLYRSYTSSGTQVIKAVLMTVKDRIYQSTWDFSPSWLLVQSTLSYNQHFSFAAMNNKVIMTGDGLTDPVKQFDVAQSSMQDLFSYDGGTNTVVLRGKYLLNTRNYLILANVQDITNTIAGTLVGNTTYYPSRLYFSILLQPSSMTVARFIEIRTDDGEQITGIGELNSIVQIFKETSIHNLDFSVLNLTQFGGDFTLKQKVYGFGCIAPRSLVNTGIFYIFLAKDGIRMWDGGGKTRLDISQESRIISTKIEPIIQKLIRAGTYKNAVAVYYPKRQWYIFSYEDPERFPKGRNNSILVYDIINDLWFPFNNWNADSFTVEDGRGDNGDLLYGDSVDGYVYVADKETDSDDARKELVLNTMDSTLTWVRGTTDYVNVLEGTGSIKMNLSSTIVNSSITLMQVINAGEWQDKTKITKADKISFKVFVSSIQNLISIRTDLEIKDVTGDFDNNFTSVTISSAGLTAGNTAWSTIEISLSSFPILDDWTNLGIESFTFANTLTFYGVRFVSTGTGDSAVSIDDLRFVQATNNPLNSYRFTKQYNLGTTANKRFRQLIWNREQAADTQIAIDVFNNFGQFSRRIDVLPKFSKELFVSGFNGLENVTKLNSVDFSVLDATQAVAKGVFAIRPFVVDDKFIYGGDQSNYRLIKIDKTSMTALTFVSTFGALGTGTTNFSNAIFQLAVDDKFLYICDLLNQRVKIHDKNNLNFVNSFGALGTGTSNFHNPTGVAVDERFLYVGDDGNYRIIKLDKSTGGFVVKTDLNLNTVGDTTLAIDERYLYDAYNSISEDGLQFQDILLEKRNKSDLAIVNKVKIRPNNSVAISSYALQGDISISDNYIYISFTDDPSRNGNYFLQKRLKSNFAIVKELKTRVMNFAVSANGIAYLPKIKNSAEDLLTNGSYIQLKYSDDKLDNQFKLFNMAILVQPEELKESK